MDTKESGRTADPANSTLAVDQRTMCDDSRDAEDDAVTVDANHSATSTEVDGPSSTIEMASAVGDGMTVVSVGSTRDADSTRFWDSQATASEWVESTLGAWKSTVPVSAASQTEVVPGFEILVELGRGGMGVVYKARQERLKRLVALKMIRDDWHGNREHLARFDTEAEAVARLDHPNIVRIYEIGRAGWAPYVAFELLEGGTLKERLAGTTQPFRESAELLAALARGVHAAHVARILHRDLKPSNVLFDHAGIPKIADFGLAKRLEVEEGQTQTGQVIGTPSYMAPEQAKGWDRDIGPAADIYSLGAILYEMLTGRPPLKGATQMETIRLVQEEDPVPPSRLRSRLPFDLETICLKCITRDPHKRYPDALGLAEDLDRYLTGESILARRTPLWERGFKRARKKPVTVVLVAVGIVAAGIAAGAVLRVQADARSQQKKRADHVTRLAEAADQGLIEAERALAWQRWDEAQLAVTRLLTQIERESEPRINRVRDKAELLQAEARRGRAEQTATEQAQAQFRRFVELRDEALFLDTTRFADGLGNSALAICRAARLGLGVFGQGGTGDEWVLSPLPPALPLQEQDEVKSGSYQLMLILADAVAQLPGTTPAQRADEALRIVNRADGLRSPATRALHLRRADLLEMKGDHEGAARARDQARRLAPADAFDLFLIGRESIKRSDWRDAITHLEAATQSQPEYFWATCLLAICHLQTAEPAKALIGLNACLDRKPDRAWLYMLRGITNAGVGRLDAAEADYRRALELLGDKRGHAELYYVFLLNRGMLRLVRNDLAAAAADFDEAIRLSPGRFEAYVSRGQVYQRLGQTDDALKQFAKAMDLRPNWAPLYRGRANILLGVTDLSPELREMNLSDLENQIGRVSAERRDAALRDLEDAIRFESPGDHLIASDWTKQAALFHEAELHHEALDACVAALKVAPRYAPAHELRVKVLLDLEEYDDLIPLCDVILTLGKPSAKFYELRGIAKNKIGDFSGAIGDYTQALDLSLEDDRPRLLRKRAWSNVANEAIRPAVHDFDEAIRLAPTNADAYLGRGLARARLGLDRDAESDAERALKFGDGTAMFTFRVARVYCEAVVAVRKEARSNRQDFDRPVLKYQDIAVKLVGLAVARTAVEKRAVFFHETILKDPAMKPIFRTLMALERRMIDQPAPP